MAPKLYFKAYDETNQLMTITVTELESHFSKNQDGSWSSGTQAGTFKVAYTGFLKKLVLSDNAASISGNGMPDATAYNIGVNPSNIYMSVPSAAPTPAPTVSQQPTVSPTPAPTNEVSLIGGSQLLPLISLVCLIPISASLFYAYKHKKYLSCCWCFCCVARTYSEEEEEKKVDEENGGIGKNGKIEDEQKPSGDCNRP